MLRAKSKPRYYGDMEQSNDTPAMPPEGWLQAIDEAEADLAAGRTVPLGPVIKRMRDALASLEAKMELEAKSEV